MIARLNLAERPAITPSGMPTRRESETAANIRAKVSTASSQSPSTAKLTNAANVPIAAFTPPKRSTINVPSAAVPGHFRK